MGFFCKRIFLFLFKKNELFKNYESAPPWYSKLRIKIWMIWSLFILAGLIFYYVMYSKYGASAANVLPRPLWGILAWSLSFFSIISIFILIHWDQSLGDGWYRGGLAVLLATLLVGAVIQSRAISIFFTIPFLCVVFQMKSMYVNLNNKKVFLILFIWLVFIFINVSFINLVRYDRSVEYTYLFNFVANDGAIIETVDASFNNYFSQLHASVLQFSRIVIDRWIGMEGVMSLVAFPDRSMDLFIRSLSESREIGKLDIYTSEIVGIELSQEVLKSQQYTAVPGGIAFFYFTGSLLWVFIGMFILTFLMLSTERLVGFLTYNPFVSVYWGMSTAFLVVSIAPALIHPFKYFSFSLFILFLIWLGPRVLHYFKHRAY